MAVGALPAALVGQLPPSRRLLHLGQGSQGVTGDMPGGGP